MAFAIKTGSMPGLCSFKDCAQYFERTPLPTWKAKEGETWTSDERPLDDHRMYHKRIVKGNAGQSYQLWLYRTCMLIYFKDGGLRVTMSSDTASSMAFLSRLSPGGLRARSVQGKFVLEIANAENETEWLVPDKTWAIQLDPIPGHLSRWTPVSGFVQRKRAKLNTKKATVVNAQYKELLMWLRSTAKVLGISERMTADPTLIGQICQHSDDPNLRQYLLAGYVSPNKLRTALLRYHGAFDEVDIPNTTPIRKSFSHDYT
jgi:hypothetical protein